MKVDTIVRLSREQYEQLEKSVLSNIVVSDKTTDIQAGYMLGIQEVLRKVRIGFAVGL